MPTSDRAEVFNKSLRQAASISADFSCEIIVVDDSRVSPIDQSTLPSSVRLVRNQGSGVASARNLGASVANGVLVLFLDDDILITRETLSSILRDHQENPEIVLNPDWKYPAELMNKFELTALGRFLSHNRMNSFEGWYGHPGWKRNQLFETPRVASFHLSLPRNLFLATGGYNESYPYAGYEDYDFPKRLHDAGIRMFIDARICVMHNESDRIDITNWLDRQRKGAATRSCAVENGHLELKLRYSGRKRLLVEVLRIIRPVLLFVYPIFERYRAFDWLLWPLIGSLQAVAIYEGYSKSRPSLAQNKLP